MILTSSFNILEEAGNMRCTKAQQRLEAYLGGEMEDRERTRLERHFASCTKCDRALERARQMRAVLRREMAPPVPDGFHARLMARAREHAGRRRWSERILRPFGWRPAMPVGLRAAAAAGVIVALGLGMLIGRDMWHAGEPWEASQAQVAEADPVRLYRLDYLGDTPEGSMTGAYVSLVSTGQGE